TIQLVPASKRDRSTRDIVQEVSEKINRIAGADIVVSEMEASFRTGDAIQVQLTGPEHDVLRDLANLVEQEIKEINGVFNPKSQASTGVPQMKLTVDHEKA